MRVLGSDERFVVFTAPDHGTRRAYYIEPDAPDRRGLLGVVLKMNQVEQHTEVLGDATLEAGVGGLPLAFLWFVPPTPADRSRAASAR